MKSPIAELKDYADKVFAMEYMDDPGDVVNNLLNLIAKLPSESTSLSSAEEAIGFAEWCEENYCRHMSSNWIENKNAMNVAIKNSDLFSTSDLYNLYQQSKK